MRFSSVLIAAAILTFTTIAATSGAAANTGRPGNICSLATMGLPIPCRPH